MSKPLLPIKSPRHAKYLRPVLEALRALGGSAVPHDVYKWISENYDAPKAETDSRTKHDVPKFEKHVATARFWLARMGLIKNERGIWPLTERGRNMILSDDVIRHEYKKSYDKYQEEQKKKKLEAKRHESIISEEIFLAESIQETLKKSLAEQIYKLDFSEFKRLCRSILLSLGFEETHPFSQGEDEETGGKGFLFVNRLIRTKVIYQCKQHRESIGSWEIRNFRDAIAEQAKIGIFLTAGTFTKDAMKEATRKKAIPIELIDIDRLLGLAIREQLIEEVEVKTLRIRSEILKPPPPEK